MIGFIREKRPKKKEEGKAWKNERIDVKVNLRYQMMQVLNFKEGTKKKEYYRKHGRGKKDKIFSYQEQKNLKDTAEQFARWMQEHHKQIRLVRDIKKEHVQEWMDVKAKSCSLNTLDAYINRLEKVATLCNKYYESCELDWKGIVKNAPATVIKQRDLAFTQEQWIKIMESRKKKSCDSYKALRLAEITGQRVESLIKFQVRDFDFENKRITVFGAKGGRIWSIPMREEDIPVLKKLTDGLEPTERIVKVSDAAINTYLRRACKECGFFEFSEHKTGIHAVRKMVAQREYDRERNGGKTREEAEAWVNEFLGHGENREDLAKIYILRRK